jgi:NDP-sugar pyrophosphorylase family protein
MNGKFTVAELFGERGRTMLSVAYERLMEFEYPWQILPHVERIIREIGEDLPRDEYIKAADDVWIAKSARIAPSASIGGPCIVCREAEVRHCAFIRRGAIVGRGAVVGNATELKNCILFDGVQLPHYNYVGDSVLGYRAHLGAGAIISNVKGDKSEVYITLPSGERIASGLKKCGAFLAAEAEIGAGCVLNPGSVIGARARIYPLTSVRGYVPQDSVVKGR